MRHAAGGWAHRAPVVFTLKRAHVPMDATERAKQLWLEYQKSHGVTHPLTLQAREYYEGAYERARGRKPF